MSCAENMGVHLFTTDIGVCAVYIYPLYSDEHSQSPEYIGQWLRVYRSLGSLVHSQSTLVVLARFHALQRLGTGRGRLSEEIVWLTQSNRRISGMSASW